MKITVLLTCFNRKEKTLSCLSSLFNASIPYRYQLKVFLVDDASTDGTSNIVKAEFPQVHIIAGTGGLFWNRGMLLAWEQALTDNPEFVLWLNDDTIIDPDSIEKMLETHKNIIEETSKSGIVVGATKNSSNELTYGGIIRPNKNKKTTFKRLQISNEPQPCTTMNGNFVLISRAVFNEIGLLDNSYQHGMGDLDYGFRATNADIPIWVAPGFIGYCDNDNSEEGSYKDTTLPLRDRWQKISGQKGLPPSDWRLFCQRHAGMIWPVFWLWPYAKVVFTSVKRLNF